MATTDKMIDEILKVVSGDCSIRLGISDKSDGLDLLSDSINKLIEKLCEKNIEVRQKEDTLKEIEKKYQRLQENIPGMVYLHTRHSDGSSSLPYVNFGSKILFDTEPEDFMRNWTNLTNFLHPDDKLLFDTSLKQSVETLQPWRKVLRHIIKGELRWYDHMRHPELQPDGDILWLGIIIDVTAHKLKKNALEMFQFCIDHAADAVFWINSGGGYSYVNDEACRSLGYSRRELLGLRLWDIDPYFPKDRFDEEWTSYQQNQMGSQFIETLHRRKDGVLFPVEVSSRHIWFGDQEFHVAFVRDVSKRKKIEEDLHLTKFAIDHASISCWWIKSDGRLYYVNDQACRSLGYSRDELLSMSIPDIDPDFSSKDWSGFWRNILRKKVLGFETVHQRKDGSTFPVEITANHLEFGGQEYSCAFSRDISELKRAEEEKATLELQLTQAQKMESIGRLAGGVAHDFNNMLSVILGYAELAKSQISDGAPVLNNVLAIEKAAMRSRDTTRQLLAFSRKEIIEPKPMELNSLIKETQQILAKFIGEDIELSFYPHKNLWKIKFDSSQIHQILVNLAVNARDAMPEGGKLTIETANVTFDDAYCHAHHGFKPGEYVLLAVSDDGMGMDKQTLANIFEPFFTTKDVGKGTGLGLSTIYGIVKQNEAFINVYSEPGKGSSFKIYIPRTTLKVEFLGTGEKPVVISGSGTVLLVEDDAMVRGMATAMLKKIGYTVLVTESPSEALLLCKNEDEQIDLLVTDVVMPEMNGSELKDKIEEIRPGIKVLYMSGYTSNVIVNHGVLEEGVYFIQKPFSMQDFSRKVFAAAKDQ